MKIKKVKRILSLILCVVMVMGTLAGCGKGKQADANTEEVELTVWAPVYWVGQKMNYEDNEVWQQVQKDLGIKLKFIHPPVGQEAEQFNIMISSGEYPDIISTGWMGDNLYAGGLDKYVEDGVLLRLNDLIDKYAPDYKSAIENVVEKEQQKLFYTDAKNMVQFYAISPYEEWSYHGLLLRKDWMEELNMGMPETLEEYEALFVAFKEKMGADVPLILSPSGIDGNAGIFLSAYNIAPDFYQVNGKVKYGLIQPEFKEYLALMNRWYKMGLIDKDFATMDEEGAKRLLTTGETGAICHSPDTVGGWMNGIAEMTVSDHPYPVMNSGDRAQLRMKTYQARTPFAFAVTTACKNPEAAVKFLNYGYTEKGYMLYNYGIEGETYNRTGEVVTYNGIDYPLGAFTDKMLNNKQYPSIADAVQIFKVHIGPYIRFEHEANPGINKNNAVIRQKLTDGADTTLNLPMLSQTADEGEEFARIMNQVNTYASATILEFIMGIRSLDEFDNYVDEMKAMEIEQAISIVQDSYDRYQKR